MMNVASEIFTKKSKEIFRREMPKAPRLTEGGLVTREMMLSMSGKEFFVAYALWFVKIHCLI
jgi:hypothetical protein